MFDPFYLSLLIILMLIAVEIIIAHNFTNINHAITFRWEHHIITDLNFMNKPEQHSCTIGNRLLFCLRIDGCIVLLKRFSGWLQLGQIANIRPTNSNHILMEE